MHFTTQVFTSLTEYAWRCVHPRRAQATYRAAYKMLEQDASRSVAREAISRFLAFPWWEVRNLAVKIIGKRCDTSFTSELHSLLRERTDTGIVRRNAVAALARTEPDPGRSISTFTSCLTDPYWEVRRAALEELAASGPLDDAAFSAVAALTKKERSFEVHMAAARALGRAPSQRAFPLLRRLACHRSWLVRLQSAVSMVELSSEHPALQQETTEALRALENICAGVTGHMLFRERLSQLETLLNHRPWPARDAVEPLYLIPGIPWTRQ